MGTTKQSPLTSACRKCWNNIEDKHDYNVTRCKFAEMMEEMGERDLRPHRTFVHAGESINNSCGKLSNSGPANFLSWVLLTPRIERIFNL